MRLKNIRTPEGVFGLLALDQVPQLSELLQFNQEDSQHASVLNEITLELMRSLSAEASGVIVSPEHTFHTIIHKAHSAGLLLSLEQRRSSVDPLQVPRLPENWGPEHVRNNYGLAKLELYYHPQEENALKKKQLVAEVFDYCQYLGMDFLLDLKVFQLEANAGVGDQVDAEQASLFAVEDFRGLCHVIALELPGDALAAVTLTAELDIPWLLTSSGDNYEQYKEKLRLALESGAAGFVAGCALWAEMPEPAAAEDTGAFTLENTMDFIHTTVRDRLIELMRISREAVDPQANFQEAIVQEASSPEEVAV